MKRGVLIGLGAAALLGGGLWLGRSSATSAPPAQPAPQVRSAALPAPAPTRAARTPSLPSRHVASTPGLTADLTDADPKIRRAAIREAVRESGLDPQVLLAASRDSDLEVGVVAMDALGRRYADGSVPVSEMIARATDHALNARVRTVALNAIGLVPSGEAASVLVELLARGDSMERASAAILLVHQDPELAMPALISALGDTEERVRENALEALRSRSRGRDFGTDAAAWRAWWSALPR